MKHLHHILPRHAGGLDTPENLVELTIEEHANAHKELFEKYGRIQDKLAWQGLSGLISKEEIIEQLLKQPKSEEWKQKNRKPKKDKTKYFGHKNAKSLKGKPKSEEHKKSISDAHIGMKKDWLVGNKHAASLKGRTRDPAHQESINRALNDPEVKQKISSSWAKKTVVTCPHCGTQGKEGHNMNRYHFDKCKRIKNG